MVWLLTTFLITILMGIPVIFVLGISALTYFVLTGQTHYLIVIPQRMFAGVDQFILLAIPLFVLAGALMDTGGLTRRLLEFANAFVGRFRGGTSLTAIWGSFMFSGISGSAAADAAAMSSVLIPDMKKQGYDVNYAAALIAVASLMDPLIPPSITMIIYGALSGTSIAKLFIGGIVPGLLLALSLTAYAVFIAHKRGYPRLVPPSPAQIARLTLTALPVLFLPVLIVVGIRGGVFTATEAAAVAAIYALLVAGLWYRVLSWSHLRHALLATAVISSAIYLLIAMANIAAFVFALERLPQAIVAGIQEITDNRILIILMVNLVLLALGMFLDVAGVLILTVPALVGIGAAIGMDPVHLGVMVTFNTIIGFVHPPLGLCLFIVAGVAKTPIEKVTMQALPMIGIAIALLMLIAFVPQTVLFLPNLLVK
ncbi:MAG TPA: TRAP transporter large permease [Xanthobacteraceae bacterium]|nr:TRAP transporter large permease [Xanthobacteraceae bacterium]